RARTVTGGLTSPARPVMGGGVRKTTSGVLNTVSPSQLRPPRTASCQKANAIGQKPYGLEVLRSTAKKRVRRGTANAGEVGSQKWSAPESTQTAKCGNTPRFNEHTAAPELLTSYCSRLTSNNQPRRLLPPGVIPLAIKPSGVRSMSIGRYDPGSLLLQHWHRGRAPLTRD
ncbi:MAG: hypothetical protein RLZZ436_1640, partial [Planctomycetota bacterium]